jgi:hypothetical protein
MTKKKTRDSNMELLRIVAMLLVMIVHASYRALGLPTLEMLVEDPQSGFLRLLTESFSIMAVNVFVMLSGWYGIRLRWSRLAELLFQVLFFGLVCVGIAYIATGSLPTSIAKCVLMLGEGDYWFVKTYLALYLLSPVLNAFVEHASRRQMETTLLTLFAFQWVFGWIFNATIWLNGGYSLPSFVCLYLLARYMNIHRPRFTKFGRQTDISIYIVTCAFMTVSIFLLKRYFNLGGVLYYYNSPTAILAAAYLLLFFSKLHLQSRIVNWVAISALAIYLTHSNSYLCHYYDGTIRLWCDQLALPSFLLYMVALIAVVFVGSILLDKVRLLVWRPFQHYLSDR